MNAAATGPVRWRVGALARWRAVFATEPSTAAAPIGLRLHALNGSARLLEALKRYPESAALMRQSLLLKAAQPDASPHCVHIRQKQCAWPHDLAVREVTPNQFLMDTSLLAMMGLSDDGRVASVSLRPGRGWL